MDERFILSSEMETSFFDKTPEQIENGERAIPKNNFFFSNEKDANGNATVSEASAILMQAGGGGKYNVMPVNDQDGNFKNAYKLIHRVPTNIFDAPTAIKNQQNDGNLDQGQVSLTTEINNLNVSTQIDGFGYKSKQYDGKKTSMGGTAYGDDEIINQNYMNGIRKKINDMFLRAKPLQIKSWIHNGSADITYDDGKTVSTPISEILLWQRGVQKIDLEAEGKMENAMAAWDAGESYEYFMELDPTDPKDNKMRVWKNIDEYKAYKQAYDYTKTAFAGQKIDDDDIEFAKSVILENALAKNKLGYDLAIKNENEANRIKFGPTQSQQNNQAELARKIKGWKKQNQIRNTDGTFSHASSEEQLNWFYNNINDCRNTNPIEFDPPTKDNPDGQYRIMIDASGGAPVPYTEKDIGKVTKEGITITKDNYNKIISGNHEGEWRNLPTKEGVFQWFDPESGRILIPTLYNWNIRGQEY